MSLTQAEKEQLLAAHNHYRSEVGIPPLLWSDQVASVAQAYADKLAREHADPPGHSNGEYGENLFWGTGTYSPDACVDSWGAEKSRYTPGTVLDASNYQIFGHYTQIVWKDTRELGGGKVSYDGKEVWICNYNPRGNYLGQRPYPV